jgi:hypothetical protein
MSGLYFVLLLLGAICFAVAALGRTAPAGRPLGLVPLGLLFWILVPLIQVARVAFNS